MISAAIANRLSTDAGVAALAGTRVFPNYARQRQPYPQVVYEAREESSTTYSGEIINPVQASVTVACVARTFDAAEALAAAVLASLDGQAGTWGGVAVPGVWLEGTAEEQEVDPTTEQALFFIKELTFTAFYDRA